jgi:hypothetical protein
LVKSEARLEVGNSLLVFLKKNGRR